jgi:hypothetical protein
VTAPEEKIEVDINSVMKHLEQMILLHIREVALCRSRIDQLTDEAEELKRQLRVQNAVSERQA